MEKSMASFFLMDLALLFAGVGFVAVAFGLSGFLFVVELMAFLVFMFVLVSAMASVYNGEDFGWIVMASVMALILIDLFFIFIFTQEWGIAHSVTAAFSAGGLIVSLINVRLDIGHSTQSEPAQYYPTNKAQSSDELKEQIKQESDEIKQELSELREDIKEEIQEERKASIQKKFTPGKYVASRKANKFHAPKCDWANRIRKANEVWFNSAKEAEEQGFEADECIA